ncbi:MAG: hypothetical protein PWP27_544 [Clostridiales bacterium]|jgi:DNA-binding GntR family transcriptional regulator|nr:hypothetical protein [Clostridiales bacterium]MDK2932734.1 hypothetical protein [Clostridiales bacterium]
MQKEKISKKALKEKAYQVIKNKIIFCEMMPGEHLSEEKLAAELGTSRTPIREAILQLERENLVDIYPRKAMFVSQISVQDIYEIFQIRQLIEPQVAKMVCKNLSLEKLEYYRQYFSDLEHNINNFAEWIKVDREFHSYIIGSTNNNHLMKMFTNILDQHLRVRVLASRIPTRVKNSTLEHTQIIDALIDHDEDRIEQMVKVHLTNSRDAALRVEGFIHD